MHRFGNVFGPSTTSADWKVAVGRKETQLTAKHAPEPCPFLPGVQVHPVVLANAGSVSSDSKK